MLKSALAVGPTSNKIDLLYDSECPICRLEVDFLRKRDLDNKISFTDISSTSYIPKEHGNVQFAEGMQKLRAVLPNGQVITGVDVFRQTYEAIGLGWILWLTKLPVIGQIADFVYDIWAENRLRITGRPELVVVLQQRAAELALQQKVKETQDYESEDCDKCGLD